MDSSLNTVSLRARCRYNLIETYRTHQSCVYTPGSENIPRAAERNNIKRFQTATFRVLCRYTADLLSYRKSIVLVHAYMVSGELSETRQLRKSTNYEIGGGFERKALGKTMFNV